MTNGFTRTEAAMLKVLEDGELHTREELHACLSDNLGSIGNIRPHLTSIRKKLKPTGRDIVCVVRNRKHFYLLYRPLSAD